MKNYLLLIKIGVERILVGNSKKHKKTVKNGLVGFGLIAILAIGISVAYAISLGSAFNEVGAIYSLPIMMFFSLVLLVFLYGTFDGFTNLFSYKDYPLLSSMPIKKSTLVLSKLTTTYLINVAITVLILMPANIVYAYYVPQKAGFYLSAVVLCLILPLILVPISILFALIIKLLVSRFKNSKQIETVLMIVFYTALTVAFLFLSYGEDSVNLYAKIPISKWYFNALTSIEYLLYFTFTGVVLSGIITTIITIFYHNLYSVLTAVKTSGKYKLKKSKVTSPFFALVKKEFRKTVSIVTYAMNSYIGAVMFLIIAIGAPIALNEYGLLDIISPYAVPFVLIIVCFTVNMNTPTSASLSLEGNAFGLLKTLPVSTEKILMAKLVAGTIVSLVSALLGTTILVIVLEFSFIDALLTLIGAITMTIGLSALGLFFNSIKINLDWSNVTEPVKQSLPVILTVLVTFAITLLLGVIGYYGFDHARLALLVQTLIACVLCALGLYLVLTVSVKKFNEK